MPEQSPFPMAFVDIIASRVKFNFDGSPVEKRPISPIDPDGTIAIFPEDWLPSTEIEIGRSNFEPTFATYKLAIQNVTIHGDLELGRAHHAADSKALRAMLYRDQTLHVGLGGLEETFMGSVERVKKYRVTRQNFQSARLDLSFYYLCKTEIQIETETTTL